MNICSAVFNFKGLLRKQTASLLKFRQVHLIPHVGAINYRKIITSFERAEVSTKSVGKLIECRL